jgi:hypothetical protein
MITVFIVVVRDKLTINIDDFYDGLDELAVIGALAHNASLPSSTGVKLKK